MPRYDAQKNPFGQRIQQYINKKINDQLQRVAKAIPCHVTAVDKDFVTVAFETHDNNFTPPTVKLPQSFSPYARNPTQVGDKGYAVPSDYYLGGVSGLAGGQTNYYPRSNLSPLSFQPISQTTNAERDYNQYTVIGGPSGLVLIQNQDKPQSSQSSQSSGGASTSTQGASRAALSASRSISQQKAGMRPRRLSRAIPGVGFYADMTVVPRATGTSTSDGTAGPASPTPASGQQATTTNKARFSIDGQGTVIAQDGSQKYRATVDAPNGKSTVEAPLDGRGKVFIGGDGKVGLYAPLLTSAGPCAHSFGRIG